jgi:hypothetical protein
MQSSDRQRLTSDGALPVGVANKQSTKTPALLVNHLHIQEPSK